MGNTIVTLTNLLEFVDKDFTIQRTNGEWVFTCGTDTMKGDIRFVDFLYSCVRYFVRGCKL